MELNTILEGEALAVLRTLPDACVHTVVTSPPYWDLRDYGTGTWTGGDPECDHKANKWESGQDLKGTLQSTSSQSRVSKRNTCAKCGATRQDEQLGLEATPEEFVERLVAIFREVKRVLRNDGTVWLNLGDSYAGSWGNYGGQNRGKGSQREIVNGSKAHQKAYDGKENWRPPTAISSPLGGGPEGDGGLKPKDLIGIPWMVAFALRADGWYLRQDIIWHKPNPMPESVTDRCTKAHEYIFLLSKGPRYYYDHEAIKEGWESGRDDMRSKGVRTGTAYLQQGPVASNNHKPEQNNFPPLGEMPKAKGAGAKQRGHTRVRQGRWNHLIKQRGHHRPHQGFNDKWDGLTKQEQAQAGRNKRSVWSVATMPYKEAHFATFPPDLIVPCIKAGAPEQCCSECGTPYERLVEKELVPRPKAAKTFVIDARDNGADKNDQGSNRQKDGHKSGHIYESRTIGWKPGCECDAPDTGGVVLDPFMGSGTTALVARKLNRQYIGIELNPAYITLANKRLQELGMFA